MTDRRRTNTLTNGPNDRPTDRLGHREVSLPIINLWKIPRASGWCSQDIQRRDYEFCLKDRVFILYCKSVKIFLDQKIIAAEINQYTILPIPVYDLVNTSIRFGQYRYSFWPIPAKVYFQRFRQVWRWNLRFLEIRLDIGSWIIKINFATKAFL